MYRFADTFNRAITPAHRAAALASPLLLAALAASTPAALAQSHIVENQSVSIYVSANGGSDSNPGTQALPFQSVNRAIALANSYASRNVGTRIEVEPGVYHEYVQLGWARYNPTITLEATQVGQAVIDAADPVTGWQATSGGQFVHSFPSLGANPVPNNWPTYLPPVLYRRELVFVNGRRFEQVMQSTNMVPGTFFVDDYSHNLTIFPLPGTDMQTAQVEVATRPYAFQSHSRSNFVLRGLVFEHAATVMNQEAAMVSSGSNILVDQIEARDNNWGGFGFHGVNGVTLQNSFSHQNGALGFMTAYSKNVLAQNDEADYNNWRGEQASFYDFGMGGYKFFATHTATVDGLFAYNNGAEGLWFDTDNRQITVQNSTLEGNYDTNLQVELNVGPITIQNNALCFGTIGINLVNAKNVTFTNNTLYGNSDPTSTNTKAQFLLAGAAGGRHFTDWETHQYENVITQNIVFSGNHFMDSGAQQNLFFTYLRNGDLNTFLSTFQGHANSWFDGVQPASFLIEGQRLSLAQWKALTRDDAQWAQGGRTQTCYVSQYPDPDFQVFIATNHMWATEYAHNRVATIPVYVKNFATAAPVILRVLPQPGISSQIPSNALAGSRPGSYAGGITNIVVSSSQSGTKEITIEATSAGYVHTVTVPVNF
jgi:hypothetical protein